MTETRSTQRGMTPVRIAVVGHTNTGKTSLLRTLTRDAGFGEVSSRPSTTRHVEGARLMADGTVLVELFDTPGMEDPIALFELLELLEDLDEPGLARLDGPARVERFLASPQAQARFEQEAKVLRQLLASDAGFYVIDTRDPVLAKHRDELAVLGSCAVPLLPVLNFVRSTEANETAWREALARLGLHAIVRFDTVAPEGDGERRLYEKLATVLDVHRPGLETLIACREREAALRHRAGLRLIAELLIDAAACRMNLTSNDDRAVAQGVERLNALVRDREQHCVDALLALYRFGRADLDELPLPLIDGRWEDDLFHPETLRQMGVKLGTGAAAGAAAGAGIDLMVGGLTLGAAAAIGALAGGGLQAMRHFGDRFRAALTGQHQLAVGDPVLRLLALRQLQLIQALEARGHAAVKPIHRDAVEARQWQEARLPAPIQRARGNRHWSAIDGPAEDSGERSAAIDALAELLASSVDGVTPPSSAPTTT